MDTTLEVVTVFKAVGSQEPCGPLPALRGLPVQPEVAPVNLPIAQPVGRSTVSSNPVRPKPREIFIQGLTTSGKTFRPSDWAERLAGAMSSFRPGGAHMGRAAHIGYSPYCVPTSLGEVRCVVVNEALRELEPMAWDFVMGFAKDNDLQVAEGCFLRD